MLFVVTETKNIVFRKYTKFEVFEDALIIYGKELVIGYFKINNIVGFYVNDAESEDKVCNGCRYDDEEPHAECVLCDKAESEE